jgi:hypothetical protein
VPLGFDSLQRTPKVQSQSIKRRLSEAKFGQVVVIGTKDLSESDEARHDRHPLAKREPHPVIRDEPAQNAIQVNPVHRSPRSRPHAGHHVSVGSSSSAPHWQNPVERFVLMAISLSAKTSDSSKRSRKERPIRMRACSACTGLIFATNRFSVC